MTTGRLYRDAGGAVFVSSSAAAVLLQVAKRTVVDWCRKGRLVYSRTLGGYLRIPVTEVHRVRAAMGLPAVQIDLGLLGQAAAVTVSLETLRGWVR